MKRPISGSLCALLLMASGFAMGGSRIIRDNRIDDLGVTPNLGRGYSVATNTFQSVCIDNPAVTTPSYNMRYRFVDIETDWENSFEGKFDNETRFQYLFLKQNIKVHTEVSGSTTYHHHYIFAYISVDSYYNSIDEANSPLSESAQSLLANGDVVGFFDSCGPYYIRSIGRHSNFLALLRYTTKSSERDVDFELELKTKMRGFFAGGSSETKISTAFKTSTESKRLSINIWAYGLGKDHLADLIPTDIDSFKNSVSEAIGAMQDANTGIVTAMEVVPWTENTIFQQTLKLKDEDGQLQFEEKKNLEANAEIIAEIDRVEQSQLDQFYKASNCRRIIKEEYLDVDGDFSYDADHTWFQDLTAKGNVSKQVSLNQLSTILSESVVNGYLEANNMFLYGSNDPSAPSETDGAIVCLDKLYEQGLENVHYRTIPACVASRQVSVPVAPVLDHYCMPELARITTPETPE